VPFDPDTFYSLEGARPSFASDLAPKGVTRIDIGYTYKNQDHVEGSAVAILRKLKSARVDVRLAELYVNLPPCWKKGKGCEPNLEKMLPDGTRLEVWATDPFSKTVYHKLFTRKADR
jgi:hypothetical protein